MKAANSIMKGAYHLGIARNYLDDAVRSESFNAKKIFGSYVNKIDFVVNDIKSRLSPESSAILASEIENGDVLFFEAIAEKCAHLNAQQRETVELLIDAMRNGEKIYVEEAKEEQ